MRTATSCAALCAVMSVAHAALAERQRDVRVAESTCGEVPWTSAAWLELLRAELAADGVAVRGPGDKDATEVPRVSVDPSTCAATATSATLTLSTGSMRRTREVHLADADAIARPRVLAIAMADLVRSTVSSTSAAAAAGDAKPLAELDVRIHLEPSPSTAPTGGSPAATGTSTSTSIFATTEARTFPEGSTGLFGGRLGLLVPLLESVALVADGGVLRGSAHDSLGDIHATVVTFGAALLGTGRAGSVVLGVGPRIEGGVAWLGGEAAAATTAATTDSAGLLIIAMSAAASFRIRSSWSGVVALDAGTALYGFHGLADDRHVLDLTGPMLALRIGVAWSPTAPR